MTNSKPMKKIIFILLSFFIIFSCSAIKEVPVKEVINYKDSVIVRVDSVKVDVPVERVVDLVNYGDTLRLETSIAEAIAYADTTTGTLKGEIKNKNTQLKKEIVYKDRIIEKEVYKDKPVYVEVEKKYVPKFYKITTGLFICMVIIFIGYIIIKVFSIPRKNVYY